MDIKALKEKVKDLKVLFVDDEEEIREGTGAFLKKFFKEVTICDDGINGLEYYKDNPTQIVITDVMMPKMDGTDMVKEIKKTNPDVFVVFITALRDNLDIDTSLIDMHLNKPLAYEDLLLILDTVAKSYDN